MAAWGLASRRWWTCWLLRRGGCALPEVTIQLDELPDQQGTSVRMTYDFYQILKADGTPLDGAMMSKLLSQATRGWAVDMKNRGYPTVDGGEALTGRRGGSASDMISALRESSRGGGAPPLGRLVR